MSSTDITLLEECDNTLNELEAALLEREIKKPLHYTNGREAHDIIGDVLKLAELPPTECFDAGNLIKYIRRAGYKGGEQEYKKDVYKAANYLHRLVFGEWLQ